MPDALDVTPEFLRSKHGDAGTFAFLESSRSLHDGLDALHLYDPSILEIRYGDRLPQLALGSWKAVPRPRVVVRPEVLRRARFPTVYQVHISDR